MCGMPDGSEVNFYSMVPIYTEEMEYKFEYDAESLISLWEEDDDEIRLIPLDLHRKNVCAVSYTHLCPASGRTWSVHIFIRVLFPVPFCPTMPDVYKRQQ